MMNSESIRACLPPDCSWGESLLYLPTTGSTNDDAKTLAASGAPGGTVLVADEQTGGRGRRGRSFHSPAGSGIYLSVLLRPDCRPDQLMHLTCGVAVAMCDAVESATGLRPGIKWTNDLVWGRQKLSGILTEISVNPASGLVDYVVIGIGINCSQKAEDFPPEIRAMAASLAQVLGHPVSRSAIAAAMISALFRLNKVLLTGKTDILNAYRRDCVTLGQEISLVRGDEIRHGKALDIDEEGALIVQFSDGHQETVSSGEVSIRGMYGYL